MPANFEFFKNVDFLRPQKHTSPLTRVRVAQPSDLPRIESFVDEFTYSLFGDINVLQLFHKSHVTFCIENESGNVAAAIFLNDHPNVPSIPPWDWNSWISNIYRLELIVPRNTVFVHLAVWHQDYKDEFLKPLLKHAFKSNPFLEYVIFVIPPNMRKIDWLTPHGTRILPSGFYNPSKVQTLCLMVRQHFLTKYKIRRAVVEDNDDIVPLLHKDQKRLVQHYGEFYIAEILTRHPDAGRQMIVAEHNEVAIGVLCLNEVVNVDSLNKYFELVPYYGLRKPHPDDDNIMPKSSQSCIFCKCSEEPEFHPILDIPSDDKFEYHSTPSVEYEEIVRKTESEECSDQYSLLDVSSVHLDLKTFRKFRRDSRTFNVCSSEILSFSEYEMHLYASKSKIAISLEDWEQHPQYTVHKEADNIPTLRGEVNAFSLELAAAQPEHESECLVLLMEAAFECFPNKDYCVLCIPSDCPPFPLMKHFTRVTPRPSDTYPHSLYVLHRNVISGKVFVRTAHSADVPDVEELLATFFSGTIIMSYFMSAVCEIKDYCAYVLVTENQIVGLAIVRSLKDMGYLRTNYELDDDINEDVHKPGSQGVIAHLVIAPVFLRHSRFFLKEIHRLSDFSVLYYYVYNDEYINITEERTLCSVIHDLVAVAPKRIAEHSHTDFGEYATSKLKLQDDIPFALYLSTARHCNVPRLPINRRFVVIGASDTAIAFLDCLFLTKSETYYATFTNVTVVSPHGLPYQHPPDKARDIMFPKRNEYDYKYMQLCSLKTYFHVIHGVMTGIDRKLKLVIINNVHYLPYDELFILCGEQFQKPIIKNVPKERVSIFPSNVFLINTEIDADNALQKLNELTSAVKQNTYKIIVYGQCLEAYCCLAALLEYGISAANIVFVEPFPSRTENKLHHTVTHFNDGEIDDAVLHAIDLEGITMYKSYYFIDWIVDSDTNRIVSVNFESHLREVNIKCIAMFMYNDKTVSKRTFLAVNRAGLVFDGALVVKPNCQTNDPNIYAAGTLTKYSRRYYADDKAQKYYNREEIGNCLGQQIRQLMIPVERNTDKYKILNCDESLDMLVPTYSKPLMVYCQLPGGLYYFRISKPGKQVPLEVAMSADDYGQVIVTGDVNNLDEKGYFRLHLGQYGIVETITCLTKFNMEYRDLKLIWGKHERLLNNLLLRFDMGMITDLFDYFREPWCYAIYHNRFRVLEDDIYKILTLLAPNPGESLIEDVIKSFKENDWKKLNNEQIEELEEKFLQSPYHYLMEQKLMDFLRDNISYLRMYAHPECVTVLLHGCENSPFFKPQ